MTNRREVDDYDELYPGRFLKGVDVRNKPTLTIERAWLEELEGSDGEVKLKGTVTFRDHDKDHVLPKTNGECLKAMFGRKLSAWSGKRVVFFCGEWNGEPAARIWGSPDIESDIEVKIELPRRRAFTMTMHATGKPPELGKRAQELYDSLKKAKDLYDLDAEAKDIKRAVDNRDLTDGEARVLRRLYAEKEKEIG